MQLHDYKVYFHGDFVGIVKEAMTGGEAIMRFTNSHADYNHSGLMAIKQ